jgi:ubiquinone/menaquinone biosynthesis C-methylase UbiE
MRGVHKPCVRTPRILFTGIFICEGAGLSSYLISINGEKIMQKPWYVELYEYYPQYDQEPWTHNTGSEVDFIEDEIQADKTKRILDIGCGTGRHSLELARRGYHVSGVDLSEHLLQQARQKGISEGLQVEFTACDATRMEFKAEFDAAILICQGAFSLMESDEKDLQILKNVARALTPGGVFILTTSNAAYMLAHPPQGNTFDPVTCRESFTLESIDPVGNKKILQCTQRYYTCPELKWMLAISGLQPLSFFAVTPSGFDKTKKPSLDDFELGVISKLA